MSFLTTEFIVRVIVCAIIGFIVLTIYEKRNNKNG